VAELDAAVHSADGGDVISRLQTQLATALDNADRPSRWPKLMGLGIATPDRSFSQAEIEREMSRLWNLSGANLARWHRIVAGTGIVERHGVMTPAEVVGLSTAQRMQAYEQFAAPLAAQAALQALHAAGVSEDQVTDLIVVSCTGLAAPGVDIALIEMLGLPPTVRRTMIGFMGCFGAISGLRTAVGACAADPHAVVLMVAVELCSLHMRGDASVENQVASALFADGAAAAVLSSREDLSDGELSPAIGRVTIGASLAIPEGKDWMSWRVTDAGFAMTLRRDVPNAIRDRLGEFVESAYDTWPRTFVIHPGGPGILDAAGEAIGADANRGIECSRDVLRRFGNMSSATILFVLAEAMKRACELPAMLLAFGPGLTIESVLVV
jgi:predicted naringenin-chalcone synthase